jgi:hypothetical protein
MKRLNQQGIVDAWFLAFVLTLITLFAAIGFGIWAFNGRQDYKDNVEPKIAAAVAKAEETTSAKKDKEFVEKEKQPLRTYTGPSAYGSVSVSYPKTWSVYADETARSSNPLDASMNPGFVPGLQSGDSVALRVQVVSSSYSDVVRSFESQVKNGKVTVVPYAVAKVPSVTGIRIDGSIVEKKEGAMVVIPLRDKTLKVWTEASQYVGDFNNIILPNLSLIP